MKDGLHYRTEKLQAGRRIGELGEGSEGGEGRREEREREKRDRGEKQTFFLELIV